MGRSWYVEHNGKSIGPASSSQLKKLAQAGRINRKTRVKLGDEGDWLPASRVQGLFSSTAIATSKQSLPNQPAAPVPSVRPNQATVVSDPSPVAKTKPCHFCGENISLSAIKCRHCNEFLDGRPRDAAAPAAQQPSVNVTQVVNNTTGYLGPPKSKMVAFALAMLLGGLGFHHFYMGHTFRGLLYLLFCWTLIPSIVAFIEAIFFLLMSNESFQRSCR
jgi:hypothetical protein